MKIDLWVGVVASLVPLTGCSEPRFRGRDPVPAESPVESAPAPQAPPRALYYVAPAGSDTNAGSDRAPFRTIQRAAEAAEPGDVVIVRPGVYSGADRIVSLERGGTPDAWITFRSEQRWGAILDGHDGRSMEGWYFGKGVSHVRVEGFEIRGFYEHGFDFYGGGVHDILIAWNHVHQIGRNCTDTSNGRTGASVGAGARRVVFDGNVWHDIGRYAPGELGCLPRTAYYQNHDHGIYVADADGITIMNNVFYGLGRGWAVHRYSSRNYQTQGLSILNNSFAGQNQYRPGQIILATPTEGLRVENNIFLGPQTAALYFEDLQFPGASVEHNMIYGGVTKVGSPKGVRIGKNWERTDPRIIGAPDFRLRSDSPALDRALPLREVTHDADGVARPRGAGPDLGAYER